MRLPPSIRKYLSLTLFSFNLFIALGFVLSSNAWAATQNLVFTPRRVTFGRVAVSQSESQVFVVTNPGPTSITISSISLSDAQVQIAGAKLPIVLAAGQNLALTATFAPTQDGFFNGEMTFANNSSTPSIVVSVSGAGSKTDYLTASPASISFGNVTMGTRKTGSVVVTNNHTVSMTVNSLFTTSNGFSVVGPTTPFTMTPGESITLSLSFTPQFVGLDGSSVFLQGPALNIPLTGTGVSAIGNLNVTPASMNFGSVNLGSTTTQTLTLSATSGSVTINSASSSNSQYAISGATFPLIIPAGQSVPVSVTFSPTKSGTDAGTLTLASNASDAQASESLTGVGVTPQYAVNLSWSASTSSVAGYNVYRGTSPHSYSKINSALDSTTAYTDNTVVSGTTYYYAATSVDSNGQESSYSSPIQVAVP
jgi:hypothetical protein